MGTSLFDQPGAITSLLQQMAGPGVTPQAGLLANMPAPQAAQLPANPTVQPKPRMLDRIHDWLVDHTGGQTPAGVDELVSSGLLSADEVKKAKPGLLSLIAGTAANTPGGGPAAYLGNLENIVKMHGLASQYAEQKRLDGVRANMAQQFALPANATEEERNALVPAMFNYAIKNRDFETAKLLEKSNVESMKGSGSLAKVLAPGDVLTDKNGKLLYQSPYIDRTKVDYDMYIDGKGDVHKLPKNESPPAGSGWKPVPLAQTQITVQGALDRAAAAAANKAGAGGAMKALAAPMAAKVGQFGEMLKKADDLLPAMEAIEVGLGSSAAQDIAAHGLGVGGARIPGTQGLGSMMLNRTPEYARYQAAISPFILAAAHALSGARINQDQVKQIRESIEIRPGDGPTVRAQKKKNVLDLMNSIGGSLPQDAVAEQEAQMGDAGIQRMRGLGYSPRTVTPATQAQAKPSGPPSYEDWKKANKIP